MQSNEHILIKLSESNVRLVVVDGYVTSFNDMDNHYVDANQVMRLYNLNPKDCIKKPWHYKPSFNEIILRPRDDANYDLMERIKEFYLNKQTVR